MKTYKRWNVDHYDHYQTVTDSGGNEVQAIIKCEMEKNTMTDPALLYNGFTASDPETQRKNEIESVTKLLEQNPNNPYWQSRYNELVIKPMYGENWEADAEAVHKLLTPDAPHPVEEAYQMEKDMNEEETQYRLSQLPKNVTASKTWLERNTHGSPEEREQARRNGEALNKGVDWSKVPEVIQPNEINWSRFIEGTD